MKKVLNEIIDIEGEVEIVEEFLNAPSTFVDIEKNKDLIRLEMNIVEYPIFSKSKSIKENQILKYYFATDKSSYLEITPKVNSQIPSEFDERVFIALTKIMRDNNFSRTFYTTVSQIIDNMKIENNGTKKGFYKRVKVSIERMANTNFKFKNLYYSNQESGIVDDLIDTNMLSYRVITFKDAKDNEEELFSDKRVKEVYFITISDIFHQNIIQKGYLTFDADELLSIKDPITRAIYTMITKWRNRDLFLLKQAFFIARRIPLSWDNPYRTIRRLEKSCEELKSLQLIKHFNLVKKGKWDEAVFEFYFTDEHNKIKQQNFYDEKKMFGKTIAFVEERSHDGDEKTISGVSIDVSEIFEIFPETARRMKTLSVAIKEALKKHDYLYVKYTAEYTAYNCKSSYLKYFKDALENNWAEAYILKKQDKKEKKVKKIEVIEEAVLVKEDKEDLKYTWNDFMILEKNVQEEIEKLAYEEYLKEAQSTDNKVMRGIFEKSKKSFILNIMHRDFDSESILKDKEKEFVEEVFKNKDDDKETRGIYPTVTNFLLVVITFIQENKLDINPKAFMTLFEFTKNYEDDCVKISYDEENKIGEIIKK